MFRVNHFLNPIPRGIESSSGGSAKSVSSERATPTTPKAEAAGIAHHQAVFTDPKLDTADYRKAKVILIEALVERIDFRFLENLTKEAKRSRIGTIIDGFIQNEIKIPLTLSQQKSLKIQVIDDLLGFGPLEPLLADPEVSDIMVNGANSVYIERSGKLYHSDVTFSSEKHLINVIQKIVSLVGRRVDEASPMVDARMPDGSRFNAIIPPLSLDGGLISIRKFRKNKMSLAEYVKYDSMTPEMAKFLEICGNIRLNIVISGGTGSGKTTLLNAISGHIDAGERIITIEDTAELQLHQPHVLRLETRPANIEGTGEINQRSLVKNALRMRPDRIILGEIRGDEVIDLLSAMNTGHDGSMGTIHANSPRDCLSRLENLVGMSGVNIGIASLRSQIASAVHLIVQLSRMRDGRRRVVQIDEMVGMEGERLITRPLFGYRSGALNEHGVLQGSFYATEGVPVFMPQAEYFGKDKELLACLEAARQKS